MMNNNPSTVHTPDYSSTFSDSEGAASCSTGRPMHDTDNMAKKPELLVSIYPHSANIMYAVDSTFSL